MHKTSVNYTVSNMSAKSGQPCTFLFDGNYFPCRTDEQCAAMIGLRLVKIPSALFLECSIDGNMYARTYRRLFHEFNSEEAVKLYPNVVETLKTLHTKGIILTIASSRSHTSLAEYVESRGLSSLISYILGADDVNKGKPQ